MNTAILDSMLTLSETENIAGRLPENSRNSFVDLQSQKTVKTDQKNRLFIEG